MGLVPALTPEARWSPQVSLPVLRRSPSSIPPSRVGAYSNFLWVAVFDAVPGSPSLAPPHQGAAKAPALTEDFTSEGLRELLRIQKDRRSKNLSIPKDYGLVNLDALRLLAPTQSGRR